MAEHPTRAETGHGQHTDRTRAAVNDARRAQRIRAGTATSVGVPIAALAAVLDGADAATFEWWVEQLGEFTVSELTRSGSCVVPDREA